LKGQIKFAVISSQRRNRLGAASCTPPLKAFGFREFFYSICASGAPIHALAANPNLNPAVSI
jgi:hypothetical protein